MLLRKQVVAVIIFCALSFTLTISSEAEEFNTPMDPYRFIDKFAEHVSKTGGEFPEDGSVEKRSAVGYDFIYHSNDMNNDGIDEATEYIILGIPSSPSKFDHVLYEDEQRQDIKYCRPVTTDRFQRLRDLRSDEIAWGINIPKYSKQLFTSPTTKCDILGYRFFNANPLRYKSEEYRSKRYQHGSMLSCCSALEEIAYFQHIRMGQVDIARGSFSSPGKLILLSNARSSNILPEGDKFVFLAFYPYWGEGSKANLFSWDGREFEAAIETPELLDRLYESQYVFTLFSNIIDGEGFNINGVRFKYSGSYKIPTEEEYRKAKGDILLHRVDEICRDLHKQFNSRGFIHAEYLRPDQLKMNDNILLRRLGYKCKYLSNYYRQDHEIASKYAFIIYPTEKASEQRVFMESEWLFVGKNSYSSLLFWTKFEMQSVTAEYLELIPSLKSTDIDWNIGPLAENPSRLDLKGMVFKKCPELRPCKEFFRIK